VVDAFESELCDYTGAPFAVAVDSCTNAIHLSLFHEWRRFWTDRSLAQYGDTSVTLPRRTYVGVLQAARNAGWRVEWSDDPWRDSYRLSPTRVVDSARRLAPGMYEPGTLTCLSFHAAKQLALGRGGAILTDDHAAAEWLRRARADGRAPGDLEPYATFPGFHAYMPPDTAARGLWILSRWVDSGFAPGPLPDDPYPDLSTLATSEGKLGRT
jgi:dTDP-4-amino-4,6-dideoxygalactose transaminase